MSKLFGSPKVSIPGPADVPAAPLIPTVDEAARNVDLADNLRRRRGAASTILVPDRMAYANLGGTAAL